jgi:hypothetical protein
MKVQSKIIFLPTILVKVVGHVMFQPKEQDRADLTGNRIQVCQYSPYLWLYRKYCRYIEADTVPSSTRSRYQGVGNRMIEWLSVMAVMFIMVRY